jgi:hypothetical protein
MQCNAAASIAMARMECGHLARASFGGVYRSSSPCPVSRKLQSIARSIRGVSIARSETPTMKAGDGSRKIAVPATH